MKLAFVVCNAYRLSEVMKLLQESEIDYYTRWDEVKGKGHGTEPHLGTGSFGSTNAVLMIGFEQQAPLDTLIEKITVLNEGTLRRDDHMRLFQVPLERMV